MICVELIRDVNWAELNTRFIRLAKYYAPRAMRQSNGDRAASAHAWILQDPWFTWLSDRAIDYQLFYDSYETITRQRGRRSTVSVLFRVWLEFTNKTDALLFKLTWSGAVYDARPDMAV